MIKGVVSESLDARIRLIVVDASGQLHEIDAVVDTCFNGSLTLPPSAVAELGLPWRNYAAVGLANGSVVQCDIHAATIEWANVRRNILVETADSEPLVGMALLLGLELGIEVVTGGSVTIRSLPGNRAEYRELLRIEGQLDSPSGCFAIVAARFNGVITGKLVDGAVATLGAHGVAEPHIELVWVPGSFEIPVVAQRLAASGKYVAVICLGCVVRGDTDHYQFVAGEAARGVAEAARTTGVPVIFGVLTTDTVEQALQRASPGHNAGAEAAETAVRMAKLTAQLLGPN